MNPAADRPIVVLQPERCTTVLALAFSPDGNLLATGGLDNSASVRKDPHIGEGMDGSVSLWEVDTGTLLRTLEGHRGGVMAIIFSPDGKTLVSGGNDKTVKLWNVHTGRLKPSLVHEDSVRFVAYSPDSQVVASPARITTTGPLGTAVRLWDPHNGRLKRLLQTNTDEFVLSVAFSPDSKLLAAGTILGIKGPRGDVLLWDVRSGQLLRRLSGYSGGVGSVAFAPDGLTLASVGGGGETAEEFSVSASVWDVATGRLIQTLPRAMGVMRPIIFSTDETILVSAGNLIQLWDVSTGHLIPTRRSREEAANPIPPSPAIAQSPDRKVLATTHQDRGKGIVTLWPLN